MGESIGGNIRKYREAAGMSQGELARAIKKTRSTVSQYESDTIYPRMTVMQRIADALGVTKAQLVDSRVEYSYANLRTGRLDWADESEAELLDAFASLSDDKKQQLIRIARAL